MDSLCQQIDELTINYLEEFGHLLACKQLLDDTIKQGYFNLSRARAIMGVNNLSRLQYDERDSMNPSTTMSMTNDPFDIDKQIDEEHRDDALKWFGLLSPNVLKQSQKSFQQTIDLSIEACRRQEKLLKIKTQLANLFEQKQTFLTKENVVEMIIVE